jgi:hypothetical protein
MFLRLIDTERARIDSSGRLLVGTSSAVVVPLLETFKLKYQGNSAVNVLAYRRFWSISLGLLSQTGTDTTIVASGNPWKH